ncbi:unnamed protein product [Caenorhabditis angaria]|uniref:6-pyruvoyl tetrahydrobiopterin synthase n=1 Tax=Caenorhabditis angaria TaxID=860376 RepID=A0A9P1MS33_9PELO|nr:unnamed protein product [Caenorhabditis angaria]
MERVEEFSSAHRLHSNQLTDEQNVEVFGKCNNFHGHGHNYVWKVKLRGPIDPITGMVYDLAKLVNEMKTILATVDHKNLDKDVPYFENHTSTCENVAIYLYNSLQAVMSNPSVLYKVSLAESPKNIFSYKGQQV